MKLTLSDAWLDYNLIPAMNTGISGEDEKEKAVVGCLGRLGINYARHEHPPAATVEEAEKYWGNLRGVHCKNLFLRNWKGNRHYLVITATSTKIDLKELNKKLGDDHLSFASPGRLEKYLGVKPGAVSPFGLINDVERRVEVVIDEALKKAEFLAFHPNVNTVTLEIDSADFSKFLAACGHSVRWLKF